MATLLFILKQAQICIRREFVDPEGENVSITAQLGMASLFMTFSDGSLNIAAGATLESLVQPYYLTVTLKDESGATSTT